MTGAFIDVGGDIVFGKMRNDDVSRSSYHEGNE
jgi:hypothetical protein